MTTTVQALHSAYCRATGFDLPLDCGRESAWYLWVQKGFTPDDVTELVRYHQRIAKSGGNARSLKFRSLVVQLDYAEEDLAEIRAKRRGPPPKPERESVLRQTGRTEPEHRPPAEPPVTTPSDVVPAWLADLRALRAKLSGKPTP